MRNTSQKKRSIATLIKNLFINNYALIPDPSKHQHKKKYLIINGDDLCKDENTNNSIVKAFRDGILTSTSAFINLNDSFRQIQKIHDENPSLPIGLHLNMTLGKPVTNPLLIPHLTDKKGQFYTIDSIIKYLHSIPVEEVRKEMFAQTEKFISSGIPLNHINYHHHLAALYTPFFKVVREIALEYKVPVRNPVPASIYNLIHLNGNGGGGSTGLKKLIQFAIIHPFKLLPILKQVKPMALAEQEILMVKEKIRSSDWFIDNFYSNESSNTMVSILEQLPFGVSELMCHPGNGKELEVLTDPIIKQTIRNQQIKLISWNQLTLI